MAQILLQISDEMLSQLDAVAPGSSRKRSQFVRLAIQRALMDLRDQETKEKYRAMPDEDDDVFDPTGWDEWRPSPGRPRSKARAVRTTTKRARRSSEGRKRPR